MVPVIRITVPSPLPPTEVVARLTDFGPARADAWAGVDAGGVTVHDQGDGWAEVTEGNRVGWERERYTWDRGTGSVSAVTLESNLWGPGSRWDWVATADGTGSSVSVTAVRNGYGVKGRLVGLLLSALGTRMIRASTLAALS